MGDIGGRRDDIRGKILRSQRRTQTVGRRRSGDGLERRRFKCEKVRYGIVGRGYPEIGSVDDAGNEGAAAGDMNCLSAMVCFTASGAAARTGAGSAEVLGARQFITGKVNYFIGFQLWRSIGAKLLNFARQNG